MKSILQQLIKEMAAGGAISANAIAGGGHETTADLKKKKKKKTMRRRPTSNMFSSRFVSEAEETFDAADVISKMKGAEKRARDDEDTVGFALEDEDGNIVKVRVRSEQADDFEDALSSTLAGKAAEDGNEEDDSSSMEIAEVLYTLKDKFDIVDVTFESIPEDEEEVTDVETGGDTGLDAGGDTGLDAGGDTGTDTELDSEMVAADTGSEDAAASALSQVIDMMKADAEAKKAEAEARSAEAKAKEAGFAAQAAAEKVKQEEEILDMETYNKNKAEQEKEAKRIAQLAKYKHEVASGSSGSDELAASAEDEETVTPATLAKLLIKRMQRAQN